MRELGMDARLKNHCLIHKVTYSHFSVLGVQSLCEPSSGSGMFGSWRYIPMIVVRHFA